MSRLIPITKWNDYHPWPSAAGLRSLIFRADENGFNMAINRIGKRILINEDKFFEWCDKKNQEAKNEL